MLYVFSGFVKYDKIKNYEEHREQFITGSKQNSFQNAVKYIDDIIDEQQPQTQVQSKPLVVHFVHFSRYFSVFSSIFDKG